MNDKLKKEIKDIKYSKEFLNQFISMYDKEDLLKIMKKLKREIEKRNRSEINNEI